MTMLLLPCWRYSAAVLAIISWLSLAESAFFESIFWTTTNPQFLAECSCSQKGFKINVPPSTKLNIVCPNPGVILARLSNNVPNDLLHENLIMVEKDDAANCTYNSTKPHSTTRILMNCTHDPNGPLQYYLIVFQEISAQDDFIPFIPGHTYYFISTSDGTADSLKNNRGPGHCNDPKNNLYMRVEVYVCYNSTDCKEKDRQNEKEQEKCDCLPSHSPSPSPSPSNSLPHSPSSTRLLYSSVPSPSRSLHSSFASHPRKSPYPSLPSQYTSVSSTSSSKCSSSSTTQQSNSSTRTGVNEYGKNGIVWLVIAILVLVCSLILNMILCIKCRANKHSASQLDFGNYVIPNKSSDCTITGQPDTSTLSQSEEKKKDVWCKQNGDVSNGKINKTFRGVSYLEDDNGCNVGIPLKHQSSETTSESNEEQDDSSSGNSFNDHVTSQKLV